MKKNDFEILKTLEELKIFFDSIIEEISMGCIGI